VSIDCGEEIQWKTSSGLPAQERPVCTHDKSSRQTFGHRETCKQRKQQLSMTITDSSQAMLGLPEVAKSSRARILIVR
jgi:hypothetical protein